MRRSFLLTIIFIGFTSCRGSTRKSVDETPPAVTTEGGTSAPVDCGGPEVACQEGVAEPWSWSIADPRYPEVRSLATLELRDLVVATGQREAFAVAVHADAETAAAIATGLMGGPDPKAVSAGAWALVQTADGALHELGDPGVLVSLAITP